MKLDPSKSVPTRQSPAEKWVAWHQSLKKNFGRKTANMIWVDAWEQRGSSQANTVALREYMAKNGLEVTGSTWDDIKDFGSGVGDFIGDQFQMGQYTAWALTGIVLLGAGMLVYNIARQPFRAADKALQIRTAGLLGK